MPRDCGILPPLPSSCNGLALLRPVSKQFRICTTGKKAYQLRDEEPDFGMKELYRKLLDSYLAVAVAIRFTGPAGTSIGAKVSLNSLTTHSEIHGQESGLTTPVSEHFAS